ncbi:tyrosine-protein kinase receptor Tie-1-like [Homarus americanus]|uniref:tyrosine-protein kinase receptor Tie-1-like n=1 Tax=Homarus americanus TaxID=6706 RepID=UPI001C45AFB2|nr:tyrosine-protein kinase receptor Tie-1-like [Homarus americanus]
MFPGGQCHPQTGTCVCPPGFMGDSCQRACARGSFGHNCQLRCNEDTLGFTIAQDGDCRGLIICLPEPYGCSCAPGYTSSSSSNDTDPICTQDCSAGKYGADCTETCAGCDDGCDQYTGICVPPSPQLTVEDGSRELRITWSPPSSSKYNYTLTYQSLGPGGCTKDT